MKWFKSFLVLVLIYLVCLFLKYKLKTGTESWIEGHGHVDGLMGVIAAPSNLVQKLLPTELRLAIVDGFPAGEHPAFLFAGRQSHLAVSLNDNFVPSIADYNEVIVYIPFVQAYGLTELMGYMPTLYVNSLSAQKMGQNFYGYPKQVAEVGYSSSPSKSASVSKKNQGMVFTALAKNNLSGNSHIPASNLRFVGRALKLPVVSIKYKNLLCTDFNWDFGSAIIEAVPLLFAIKPNFQDGFLVGNFSVLPLDKNAAGGFTISTNWTLPSGRTCK